MLIKQIAYGPLNLSPEQLGRLTYGEFLDLYDGYKWREKRRLEMLALSASWITAPHLKRPIDPNDLLKPAAKKKKVTQEEKERVTREIEERLGVR
ncbi:hypothetical protein [Bacillus sp. 1NLA3E]|uniref:hypothetical protein n=1 Tax=Bacillus sp. 1NLA3E TaxID=666686 RepID=UPI000247E64A|nr:hypothetical protein [Bacillus sp. 1NLA3E]AGK52035.1 hypothetical protein B1NLA3E_01255 [Bacillus sp. 1NLA3E]